MSLPHPPAPTLGRRRRAERGTGDVALQVRDALRHLHDPIALQTHPLFVLAAGDVSGRGVKAGKALRQRLLDAIAALRPEASTADAKAWRRFRLLSLRYLDGMEIADVCRQLAISQREYRREHHQAVDAVVSLFLTRPDHAAQPAPGAASQVPSSALGPPVVTLPDTVAEEPGRLPVPLSSFVGRERELATVARLLSSVRLVTLTGAPGTGKTRLALQVAAARRASYEDGVVFVPLAHIRGPALVAAAIAQAAGVREVPRRPLGSELRDHLAGKHLLLVLDNFEQVLDAAPAVADLLVACPRLEALVTSRAALRLSGEHELAVSPLALPGRGQALPPAVLSRYEAIQLFVERAQALPAEFVLTPENGPIVAEICHRLDGLPLAIELAAAHSRLLSPRAMLARLDRRLPLLMGDARDLPARHQTLRQAIDWSYQLLTPAEQRLFCRLAVFVGGFSLEGAEAVVGERGADILPDLESLMAKSLVQRETQADGDVRFFLLQTLREFAEEQLRAAGEDGVLRDRHAGYFLALGVRINGEGPRPRTAIWLDRLQREHDNLRAALGWLLERGDVEAGLRLAAALAPFWELRRFVEEGRRWLITLLALSNAAPPSVPRADALRWAARFAAWHGEYAAARAQAEESLAVCRQLDCRAGVKRALECLGGVALELADYPRARALFEEALALQRGDADLGGAGRVLLSLGMVAWAARNWSEATACLEESLAIARERGDELAIAAALTYLGHVACAQGDYGRARSLHEQNLALHRALRSDQYVTWPLWGLGNVAFGEGHYDAARALYRQALVRAHEQGNRLQEAIFLLACARAAVASGQWEPATRLAAAAEERRRSLGSPWPPADQEAYDQALAQARGAMPEHAFTVAWTEGWAMPPDQAIAEALGPRQRGGVAIGRHERV